MKRNIQMKKSFPLLPAVVAVAFIFGGLLFIVAGTAKLVNVFSEEKAYSVATITDIEEYSSGDDDFPVKYRVWVEYERDGEKHKAQLNTWQSRYYEGMELDVYYLSDDYEWVYTKNSEYVLFLFPAAGAVVFSIGVLLLVAVRKGKVYAKDTEMLIG